MTAELQSLISETPDAFELVAAKIGAILLEESEAQRVMAAAALEDPDLWALRVYLERSNPWSEFGDPDEDEEEEAGLIRKIPIVNVWFDSDTTDLKRSNTHERQMVTGVFNIDCHGYGVSAANGAGHTAGDALAAREAQRAARLVRRILMSAHHNYLGLRGTVSRRWIQSRQTFQPSIEGRTIQHIVGMRLAMHVDFNEVSPQVEGETLEEISVGVRRHSDGLLYLTSTYEYEEP